MVFRRLVLFLVACALPGLAGAASQRTFVASYGVDSAPCSLTQPCRQFARALTQTLAGGEIIVLDSAGYGAVTIDRNVSITSPAGIYAGITVFSGAGISIVTPATRVKLRGLTIIGQGGDYGIQVSATANLEIANCEISGVARNGLDVSGSGSNINVRDSQFLENMWNGIYYLSQGGGTASLERVVSRGNGDSGILLANVTAVVTGSTVERNNLFGIHGFVSYVAVRDSVIAENVKSGVYQFDGSLRVERSTISVNGGWGVVLLHGALAWIIDNRIFDNQQAGESNSQVCACEAGSIAYAGGNAIHGTAQYSFGLVPSASVISFGSNAAVKQPNNSVGSFTTLGPL